MMLLALALSLSIDGELALRHASRLASLGPHPWGSPRARIAAEYVAAQFRDAGLGEVRLQEFESHGVRGANVLGVLRASGPEFVVVGAHHDTAPGSPGAYDDGGGIGVLIEVARVLARKPSRARSVLFASWDGEEAWSTGLTTTAGSRAFVRSLGTQARDLVAALAIEMCGFGGGTPVLHPIAYGDPRRPGYSVIAPAWVARAAQVGAARNGAPVALGDPVLSWLYQPTVRAFRVRLYGDDLSFLQSRLPAIFVSDSSFSSFYPAYHQKTDTAEKLDAAALARMGQSVIGMVSALQEAPRGPAVQPTWFSASGRVLGPGPLLAMGFAIAALGLSVGLRAGGWLLMIRLVQAGLFTTLLWNHTVPAVWVFGLPALLTLARGPWWLSLVALAPAMSVVGLGAAAWHRGFVGGVWLAPWEIVAGALALGLLWVRPAVGSRARGKRPRRRR
jgi:hypothetical protein